MTKIYKVRALVLDRDGSALAIEADAPHVLQLPGGGRKRGENKVKALKREIREELGHTIRVLTYGGRITVRRNGITEVTDFYTVQITGGHGRPSLTGRERARGLRVSRFASAHHLKRELKGRVKAHHRSAARRDLRLVSLTV